MRYLFRLRENLQSILSSNRRFCRAANQRKPSLAGFHPSLEVLEERSLLNASMSPGSMMGSSMNMSDMMAVMNLVPDSAVTNTAVQSGNWSDPHTWSGGVVPGANANVLIPMGVAVTVDSLNNVDLHTIRDDGTLQFSTTQNSSLLVDTLVETSTGNFVMGTPNQPIPSNVHATVTFADNGPINTSWDPLQFSRGFIAMGAVSIYGANTTPYEALAQSPHAGDTQLVLSAIPTNWQVGDQLILSGTNPSADQDEQLQIQNISGDVVTLSSPLKYDHTAPTGLSVYVADMTRNVVFQSQDAQDIKEHGHVMFMGTENVHIGYAGFYDLGRTDKSVPINDPMLDMNGNLIPGTGTNPRGRYAIHFHHGGTDPNTPPATVTGCVVTNSPGWGYVNHDSNVDFTNNVAFNVTGAAFVTESGSEIGCFMNNLAIRSKGAPDIVGSRTNVQDFGENGVGFWFQGPGVEVENNIAVGQAYAGFVYFTQGLVDPMTGVTTTFNPANLANPSLAHSAMHIGVSNVPILDFSGNVAFASARGLEVWFHNTTPLSPNQPDVIKDFTSWNTNGPDAVGLNYSGNMELENFRVLGSLTNPANTGIDVRLGYSRDLTFDNVDVEGFAIGIQMPTIGTNVVQGGYFNNVHDIQIHPDDPTVGNARTTLIEGNPQYGTLSAQALAGQQQYQIFLVSGFKVGRMTDLNTLFVPQRILVQMGTNTFEQLYFPEQAPNFVPFQAGKTPSWVPSQLIGKTNQQLFNSYGLALYGGVAPTNATVNPNSNGLLGSPTSLPASYNLPGKVYTNQVTNYHLSYRSISTQTGRFLNSSVTESQVTPLQQGWNLITRTINGVVQSFFVFGDTTPPTFQINPKLPLVINPADLKTGFVVMGNVTDDATGALQFQRVIPNLDQLPLQTRADGSKYVVVTFTVSDPAGNTTTVSLNVTVDPNAPRQNYSRGMMGMMMK